MNENVTNKTPKRRRWIARLLVSALCILLASSLLFVSVMAENVNSFTVESIDQSVSDSKRFFGYHFSPDGNMGITEVSVNPSSTQYVYIYKFGSADPASTVSISIPNISAFGGCSSGEDWISTWHYDGSVIVVNIWDYNGNKIDFDSYSVSSFESFYYSPTVDYFCFYNGSSIITKISYSNGSDTVSIRYLGDEDASFLGYIALPLFYSSQWVFYVSGTVDSVTKGGILYSSTLNYSLDSDSLSLRSKFFVFSGTSIFGVIRYGTTVYSYSIVDGSYVSNTVSDIVLFKALSVLLFPFDSSSFSSTLVGYGIGNDPKSYNAVYATSSEYVPPESSDETTTEPPPESSEPGEPGTLNIYRTDIDRSGGVMVFNSTLDTSIPSDGLESLSAYLGYYWDVDSSVQPPPSYMYLWASYEDGTRQRYDFDFSSYGYALGSDFAQNFYYPDYLGMEFEIPLNGETDIYFVTSSPGGSVTVENSDGRIITLNFGSTSSYARIDFVDELNYSIRLFNNDMAIGNSLTFDKGVYRYLFVYNVDSAVNTWYYPEPGTSTFINYDKVKNGLYNVVLTLNDKIPDYGKPGDFEDAVSRYEEIEGAVSSTMSETWEYLESLQEELNRSFDIVEFSEANAKLDQILSTPGGDTIFAFFKSLWGINPLLPTFAVMTVCFAGVSFIIRKI